MIMKESDEIEEYILKHTDPESDYLKRLYRDTCVNLLRPRMASGHLQGRVLKMFVKMIRPARILEIGTFSGYSALCMAEGLEEGGRLYTFEINDEQEDFTRPWIERSPYADKIEFIIGDALQLVPQMNVVFDMVFIDGNKRDYIAYFEMVMKYLRKGGFIFVDNTLWDGHVLVLPERSDRQTEGIIDFNDYIVGDKRIEKVILPLRDGLTMIRKIE
jgi:caffeoyl-CoA O-methyltransferase